MVEETTKFSKPEHKPFKPDRGVYRDRLAKSFKIPVELQDSGIIILYTIDEVEKNYKFNLGPGNLRLFLRGGIIKSVKKNKLYLIPSWGSLNKEKNIDHIIMTLEKMGYINLVKLKSFYNKPILVLTDIGKNIVENHKEVLRDIMAEKFINHVESINRKGDKYLNISESQKKNEMDITTRKEEFGVIGQHLTLRERKIYMMRYGIGGYKQNKLQEIGDEFSLSRERIRQILNKIEKKIKRFKTYKKQEYKNTLVEDLNLSPRTINALMKKNINTIDDLSKKNLEDFRNIKGFGSKAYDQVVSALKDLGIW